MSGVDWQAKADSRRARHQEWMQAYAEGMAIARQMARSSRLPHLTSDDWPHICPGDKCAMCRYLNARVYWSLREK